MNLSQLIRLTIAAPDRMPAVPFPGSYWVVPGRLLAGEYPGSLDPAVADARLTALLDRGIRRVVNLMRPDERNRKGRLFRPYAERMAELARDRGLGGVEVERYPIKDTWIPTRPEMGRILDRVDACISAAHPVYLHCLGGRGRTGTVVGCFLARHGVAADGRILDLIREMRSRVPDPHFPSPETARQVDLILSWVEGE